MSDIKDAVDHDVELFRRKEEDQFWHMKVKAWHRRLSKNFEMVRHLYAEDACAYIQSILDENVPASSNTAMFDTKYSGFMEGDTPR